MKILFITWDGPQTTYMEGLFMPIFQEIQRHSPYKFHVIQFTWGNKERVLQTQKAANQMGIQYKSFPVSRRPITSIGSILTVVKGIPLLKKYIRDNQIDVLMPRSTIPAIMVNRIKNKKLKILFDADGLPLEERVEDGSLSQSSLLFKILKTEEKKIIKRANGVFVRSKFAINYHLSEDLFLKLDKFTLLTNGRDPLYFDFDNIKRRKIRQELNINEEDTLLIYIGSLGNKYALKEMLAIHNILEKKDSSYKFLLLTPSLEYFKKFSLSLDISNNIIVKKVEFDKVSSYLSAADFGFCLINQSLSMKSVAAIKLGEYLLSGLPVIATGDIGDSSQILNNKNFAFVLTDHQETELKKAANFIHNNKNTLFDREEIAKVGRKFYSVQRSSNQFIMALKNIEK